MKLTMLGTGCAMVTECYNTCFVLEDEGRYMMVDAGGGMQILRQLKTAGIDWRNMRDIFVTHKHVDHILGVIWMIRVIAQNMAEGKYEGEARIYAHEEVIGLLRRMSEDLLTKKTTDMLDKRLHLITVEDGEEREIIGHKVTFFDIRSTKAKQFGFAMDGVPGGRLVCAGDEPLKEECFGYAENCHFLLHEAFCLYVEADKFKPYEKHHSTAKDAGDLAAALNVDNLLMYHTKDNDMKNRKRLYAEEAAKSFSGGIFVPDDLEVIELK